MSDKQQAQPYKKSLDSQPHTSITKVTDTVSGTLGGTLDPTIVLPRRPPNDMTLQVRRAHIKRLQNSHGNTYTAHFIINRERSAAFHSSQMLQREVPAASSEPAQATNSASSSPDTILAAFLAALVGVLKTYFKGKHGIKMNRSLGPYAKLTSINVAIEGALEAAPKGAAFLIGQGSGRLHQTKNEMQDYGRRKSDIDKKGTLTAHEVRIKLKHLMKQIFDVSFPDIDIKWVEEELSAQEVKGQIDVSGKASNGVTAGLKLDVYNINLKDVTKNKFGLVTPYAGWQGEFPLIEIQPGALGWIGFPPIEIKAKPKVTGEAEIEPDKKRILLAFIQKFGPGLAERIALATGRKGAAIVASRIVSVLEAIFSVPGVMIAAGVMSVLTFLDAWVEGDRIRNLGELAQRLSFAYGGAFAAKREGSGAPAGAGGTISAQFTEAGTVAAQNYKDQLLTEAKQKAAAEGANVSDEDLRAEIDKQLKEHPIGIMAAAEAAKPRIDEYILDKFVKGRERSLLRRGMNTVLGVFGFGLGEVRNSHEYKKFQEDYLPAYTNENAREIAAQQAVKELQKQGKPITTENLQQHFANKANQSENALK